MIHSYTRAYVENILLLMSTYKNIQHILIVIHLYTFWKRKHTFMLKVLRQTLHLIYILNICYHKLLTYIWSTPYKFYCFTHIYLYAYWETNYILHIFAFKKAFHTIIHSFRKTIIHTLLGISCSLYLPMYTRAKTLTSKS